MVDIIGAGVLGTHIAFCCQKAKHPFRLISLQDNTPQTRSYEFYESSPQEKHKSRKPSDEGVFLFGTTPFQHAQPFHPHIIIATRTNDIWHDALSTDNVTQVGKIIRHDGAKNKILFLCNSITPYIKARKWPYETMIGFGAWFGGGHQLKKNTIRITNSGIIKTIKNYAREWPLNFLIPGDKAMLYEKASINIMTNPLACAINKPNGYLATNQTIASIVYLLAHEISSLWPSLLNRNHLFRRWHETMDKTKMNKCSSIREGWAGARHELPFFTTPFMERARDRALLLPILDTIHAFCVGAITSHMLLKRLMISH